MKIYCDGSTTDFCVCPEGDCPPIVLSNPPGISHNESEYLAVIAALGWLLRWDGTEFPFPAEVISDSQLVVRQLNGVLKKMGRVHQEPVYDIKDQGMQALAGVVEALLQVALPQEIRFVWVPREENRAGQALEAGK